MAAMKNMSSGARVLVVLAVVVGLIVIWSITRRSQPTDATPMADYTPRTVTYAYYVEGSASGADVTYRTGTGTSQASVDLPLKNESGTEGIQMTSANAPQFLYISAQNSDSYGDVTCRIEIDGVVVSKNTASGGYKIATCEYSG